MLAPRRRNMVGEMDMFIYGANQKGHAEKYVSKEKIERKVLTEI